jgi:nucleotide-binding universal stress UspA family protein
MKILLPVDGTPASLQAVRHALRLRSEGLAAEYVLANVQVPPTLYEVVVAHDVDVLDEVRRAAGADLLAPAEALMQAAGADWESEVAGGEPANVLLELIDNYGCDAVVMGAGPLALSLIGHGPVPVTVVHAED